MYTSPLPKADSASVWAIGSWRINSLSLDATRMPRPPPPPAALISTGKPTLLAAAFASARLRTTPSLPGISGTPASRISLRASALFPILLITSAGGPMKVMPTLVQTSARYAFSERNP